MFRKLVLMVAMATTTVTALPTAALAHDGGHGHRKHHHYRSYYEPRPAYYYRESYAGPRYSAPRYRSCRTGGTTGLIVGGAAGALLGRELDGGRDRATGTVLGGAAGALLGREVARKSRC
jgi:hypothetical protein